MGETTPRDAVPATERRKEQVAEAMAGLTGIENIDTRDQFARLDEAQSVLAGVLANATGGQPGLPGLREER